MGSSYELQSVLDEFYHGILIFLIRDKGYNLDCSFTGLLLLRAAFAFKSTGSLFVICSLIYVWMNIVFSCLLLHYALFISWKIERKEK